MTLSFLGPVREGGGARVALSGAPARSGLVWRVVRGGGSITLASAHADEAGFASAYYSAGPGVEHEDVQVEVDAYA
jgi:hypothetical protein